MFQLCRAFAVTPDDATKRHNEVPRQCDNLSVATHSRQNYSNLSIILLDDDRCTEFRRRRTKRPPSSAADHLSLASLVVPLDRLVGGHGGWTIARRAGTARAADWAADDLEQASLAAS